MQCVRKVGLHGFSSDRVLCSRYIAAKSFALTFKNVLGMTILSCGFWMGVTGQTFAQEDTLDEILDTDPTEVEAITEAAEADWAAHESQRQPAEWVDYFAQFEATYADQLADPDQNGFRDMLIAIGPSALEQRHLVQCVAWEDFPTNELSQKWWNDSWLVICDKLHMDPLPRPPFLGYRELSEFVRFEGITGEEPPLDEEDPGYVAQPDLLHPNQQVRLPWESARDYESRLFGEPWTAEENPQAARWLEETSPVLDIWTKAVRKPAYTSYYLPAPLIGILLPDIQFQRSLARSTLIRCQQRIAAGEIDAAIEDAMTLFYLSRHAQRANFLITRLVGIAIEQMGDQAIRSIVHQGNPSAEQLASLREQLESLPQPPSLDRNIHNEMLMALDTMQRFCGLCSKDLNAPAFDKQTALDFWAVFGQNFEVLESILRVLNLDWNVMRPRIESYYAEIREISRIPDRTQRNKAQEAFEQRWEQIHSKQMSATSVLTAVLSREKRTERITDSYLNSFIPAMEFFYVAVDRAQSLRDLTRVGLSVEQYHATHGEYPATLDALVSDGLLTELPTDPFSGQGYIYDPTPFTPPVVINENDEKSSLLSSSRNAFPDFQTTPYLLYGTGSNGQDDTASWLKNGVKELDVETFQKNDDPRF